MLNSFFRSLCSVELPYHGRQAYMIPLDLTCIMLPPAFADYQEPVEKLCRAARAFFGKAFLTVDEKVVEAGCTQRRPHPHVDGCFLPSEMRWGGHPGGPWNHYCNAVPVARMPVIVASSISACRAWEGRFDALPKNDGDLSHIQDELGAGELLPAHTGYLLSPDCVHESLPMKEATERTFIRIALPVDLQL